MRLSRLRLKNFRCYYGVHDLDLTMPGTSNLIVVYGENMRGKTTLLQAIQWCLYDVATDREKQRIPIFSPQGPEQLISTDAIAGGEYEMFCKLDFTHDGREYELTRRVFASATPEDEKDFQYDVDLTEDKSLLAEASIQPKIETILSMDVSRFFLFDGEMLGDYEKLIKSQTGETAAVRQAIEMILGLPALRTYAEFDDEASLADKRLNALLTKRNKYNDLVADVGRLTNEVKSLNFDLNRYRAEQERYTELRDEAELALLQLSDIEKDLTEIHVLESEADNAKRDRKVNEERVARLLAETWWVPIARESQRRLSEVEQQIREELDREGKRRRIEELSRSVKSRTCELCGGEVRGSQEAELRKELNELELSLVGAPIPGTLPQLLERQKLYQRFLAPSQEAQLLAYEENVQTAEIRVGDCTSRAAQIRERISDRARGDIVEKQKRWQKYSAEVNKLDRLIEAKASEVESKQSELNAQQRKMSKLPDADPRLRLEAAIFRLGGDVLRLAVDRFRDRLRTRVEDEANRIFRELTTQKLYGGLRINDQYGLTILDSRGNPVPGRSAGAEQIVALSLIGGLNQAAVREGPVVMDTNFSRLDLGHRENILRFLPTLGSQVVLLVHSGELEKDADLEHLGVRIARKYEILSISETKSEVVPI